jgi:hypothetical protein
MTVAETAIVGLVGEIAGIRGSDRLFNPYAPLDDPLAGIRRDNLVRYLCDVHRFEPRVLLVAEAPGYRGCALSGIPITSERIILNGVKKWGLFGDGYGITSGNPRGVTEMTATILWNALVEHLDTPPVLWNSVPLHPHRPGNRQSNRTPTVGEQRMGVPYIKSILAIFDIQTILAVGRTAQRMLGEAGYAYVAVRHPSQGGKAAFIEGLRRVSADRA